MRLKQVILFAIIGFLRFLHPEILSARDAPITTAGSSAVCPGSAVVVPVTVTNFTSVGAITLRLDYDPTQLAFDNFSNLNPFISGAAVNQVNVSANLAKILIVWASVNPLTLPDSSKLFDLNFSLVSGSPEISFNNIANNGGDCEYADENGASMNDIPAATYYINSAITNLEVASADSILGVGSLCAGAMNVVYSIPPITHATGYIWTVPMGCTIVSGEDSPSISVNYSGDAGSGNLTVAGTNSCGAGTPASKFIEVARLPDSSGIITGPEIVCAGAIDLIYSVPIIANATACNWTVPAGAVITSGATTNQVSIHFGALPGTGIISVNGTNDCGNGPSSPDFTVTMLDPQDTAVVTVDGSLLTSSLPAGNQWVYEGTGPIAGATGQTYTATITGWYWTIVSGAGCAGIESNHVYVLFTGQEEFQNNNFSVYPVPTDGRFNIILNTLSPGEYTVLVFNQLGKKVFECYDFPAMTARGRQIDIRPAARGIYSVVLFNSHHMAMRKVLVK